MFGLFGSKTVEAKATILDAGTKVGDAERRHDVAYVARVYEVEVRAPGAGPVRSTARGDVCPQCMPEIGDVLTVQYDARKGEATFQVEGDERYDPRVAIKAREDRQVARLTEAEEAAEALNATGVRGHATVISATHGPARDGLAELRIHVHVRSQAGDEFDTVIVELKFASTLGDYSYLLGLDDDVVFDPADRTRIQWKLPADDGEEAEEAEDDVGGS